MDLIGLERTFCLWCFVVCFDCFIDGLGLVIFL